MPKKEVLLLSDAKAGHQNQSRALTQELESLENNGSLSVKRIRITFKTKGREKFFSLFVFLAYPFIQKSIPFLNFFLGQDTIAQIEKLKPDIIISAGSSLVPFTLLLSKIHKARKVILMRPAFPFSLFAYDLAIVPRHDAGPRVKGSLERILALSPFDKNLIQAESESLKKRLPRPEKAQIGILIGGDSKNYRFNRQKMNAAIDQIILACKKMDLDFIATTCRRTPKDYEEELGEKLKNNRSCALLILSNKETATNVVSAMIGLCKVIIATEESISMISEPINAGRKTVILKLNNGIYHKYARFHRLLSGNNLAHISGVDNLADKIIEVYKHGLYDLDEKGKKILQGEAQALRQRLGQLL
ncbi:MAG: ELM1/GtrOC1 family putative glycosyltransferase [Candidatus Omnitrophica bacterium]|nr:ELM1/GtrOC1 family putative glycosyltransferase [Candidatus Omnitrophota bacterium]MDD5610196.1 ELM1/GtrOC1 family putative glycosyltransferase [Candidatus Omnitrophota bacterium]